jgi:thioredoxin reductase (NADPH)
VIDVLVIGAGPCGLSAAVAATRTGLRTVVIEKGCVTNSISLYPTYGTFFSTASKLELGDLPFIISADKPTRREALAYYRRVVSHFDLDVRQYERVLRVDGEEGAFFVSTRRHTGEEGAYRARWVVVATGYFDTPNLLGVPGEDLPHVSHYYREGAPYFEQDCVVVGGGNSAAEAALDLYRNGARVTLVHFLEGMDDGVKPWILPDLTNRFADGSIAPRWSRRVERIEPGRIALTGPGRESEQLAAEWVFAMTGWTPDPVLLREMEVPVDPQTHVPAHDPRTMETERPGVFIAGVIAAGSNKTFIENGRLHGPVIARALADRRHGPGRVRSAS